jgi:hypothetical protein
VKKKFQKLIFLLSFFFVSASPAFLQAQDLTEYATIDSLKVGDTFSYSITLDREQEYDDLIFPDSTNFSSTFEIRSKKQFKVNTYKDSVAYKLQFFGTADTTLPQLPVYLVQDQDTTILYTNPVPVRFHSILAEGEESFRPLKPIFKFAAAWWPYILGLLILAVAGYYLYQYYLKKQKEKSEPAERLTFSPEPFVNPIKEFRKAIKELENAELSDQEDFKAFYIDLGDAIRQYYESLYNLPALESTSRELLTMLKNGAIDENLIDDTRAVLQEADMVKFAKFKPTTKQANRALEKAYDFLERAREIDGPRIEHLRRKHQTKIEAERKRFYEEQENREEVTA